MERRNISDETVEEVMSDPEQIVDEKSGRKAYQSKIKYSGKEFLVRIIVAENDPIVIVTLYKTSNIKKYWREDTK